MDATVYKLETPITVLDKEYDSIAAAKYENNMNLALILPGEIPPENIVISVNVVDLAFEDNFCLNINSRPALDAGRYLLSQGLIEDVHKTLKSGFVNYPVYRFIPPKND